jgi:hypothetical protein
MGLPSPLERGAFFMSKRDELARQLAATPLELHQKLDLHMKLLPPIFSRDQHWRKAFTNLIFATELGKDLTRPAEVFSLTKYTGKKETTLRDVVLFFHLEHYTNGRIVRTLEEENIKI